MLRLVYEMKPYLRVVSSKTSELLLDSAEQFDAKLFNAVCYISGKDENLDSSTWPVWYTRLCAIQNWRTYVSFGNISRRVWVLTEYYTIKIWSSDMLYQCSENKFQIMVNEDHVTLQHLVHYFWLLGLPSYQTSTCVLRSLSLAAK